jgi:dihydropyrimidine dehydrogenase (NAD+) subunit PreA
MKEKDGVRHFEVMDYECVGCNLCMHVCPVEQCITMERVDSGEYANWTTHPNNPARADAAQSATVETADTAAHAHAHAAKAA